MADDTTTQLAATFGATVGSWRVGCVISRTFAAGVVRASTHPTAGYGGVIPVKHGFVERAEDWPYSLYWRERDGVV